MRRFSLFLVGVAITGNVLASISSASIQSSGEASPIFLTKSPAGYRD